MLREEPDYCKECLKADDDDCIRCWCGALLCQNCAEDLRWELEVCSVEHVLHRYYELKAKIRQLQKTIKRIREGHT